MLTRSQVANKLGISVTSVRRLEGKKLHPKTREDGVHIFDLNEVEAIRITITPPGSLRAKLSETLPLSQFAVSERDSKEMIVDISAEAIRSLVSAPPSAEISLTKIAGRSAATGIRVRWLQSLQASPK